MFWLALRQLLGRRTATLLAGGGLLIATLGFVTLVSTSQTLTTELSGDIARSWTTPYDLLVRPAGSTTALEDERGLVRSNFLSALAGGGISRDQLDAVRRVPGVSVAAPIAVSGAVNWPAGGFGTDLPRSRPAIPWPSTGLASRRSPTPASPRTRSRPTMWSWPPRVWCATPRDLATPS